MDEVQEKTRLVTALEKILRNDDDGSIHTDLLNQLEAISLRLENESKKLRERETHLKIEGARQAVNNALITMKIAGANKVQKAI